MSPVMIAFTAGVIIGGLGGISLIGVLILVREDRERQEEEKTADNCRYLRKPDHALRFVSYADMLAAKNKLWIFPPQ